MKERIYQAAVHEITLRGLKFSIRDLAIQLGISTKTLYLHFDSKEKIISYIVERSIQEMQEKEREVMTDLSLSLKQKLQQALVNIPNAISFTDIRILHDLQKIYPEQWSTVDQYLNRGWDSIRLLIQDGISQGELRPFDMELFIRVYVGAMYHLMEPQVQNSHHLSLEMALSETVEFLLLGIYSHQS